jgi:hypothetical protein
MHGNSTGLGTGVIGDSGDGALKAGALQPPGDPRERPSWLSLAVVR